MDMLDHSDIRYIHLTINDPFPPSDIYIKSIERGKLPISIDTLNKMDTRRYFRRISENGKEVYYFNRISILNKKEMTETEIALDFPDVELNKTIVTYEIDDSELVFIQTNTNPEKSYMVYEF